MFVDPTNLSKFFLATGWIMLSLYLLYALASRPWKYHPDTPLGSIWPASVVCLLVLWQLKAGLVQGLEVHLLGLTALTLVFGTRLAIPGVVAVYILMAIWDKLSWSAIGWNALLAGVFPILFSAFLYRLAYRYLPHNFFIFVFISSFLNGALTMAFTMMLLSIFLLTTSTHAPELVRSQFMLITPLLIFPEAFINGGVMAVLSIYRPQWVLGFNQERYLRN